MSAEHSPTTRGDLPPMLDANPPQPPLHLVHFVVLGAALAGPTCVPLLLFDLRWFDAPPWLVATWLLGCPTAVVLGRLLRWYQARRAVQTNITRLDLARLQTDPSATLTSALGPVLGWSRLLFDEFRSLARRLARRLSGNMPPGCVLRVAFQPERLPLCTPPFEQWFEPVELRAASTVVLDAGTHFDGDQATFASRLRGLRGAFARPEQRLVWLVGAFPVAAWLMLLLLGGVGELIVLLPMMVVFALGVLYRGESWYVVPGGAYVRARSGRQPPRYFRARDSVLVYVADTRTVAIVRADGAEVMRAVSVDEAAFLIRAWRSPQPPPTLEQVQSCLGMESAPAVR